MHDVVIVGAGVAGSATAIHLARRGRSVLLIDRSSFPRRKPCGEGLFPRGLAELADLDVLASLGNEAFNLRSVRFTLDQRYAETRIGWAGGGAIGVARDRLDALLLDSAAGAGADIETGVQVRSLAGAEGRFNVETEGRSIDGSVIVAADGLNSGLRHQAALNSTTPRKRYGISAHVHLKDAPPARIDVYFERGFEVYLTPLGGNLVNAAVLLDRARVTDLAGRLREGFISLLSSVPVCESGFELANEPMVAGPFPATAKSAWRGNLVLVGDAAGFYDPISGNGMTLALISARHCAAAIDGHLSTGSDYPLTMYGRQCRALTRNSTFFARLILALAARPRIGGRVLSNLARTPRTFGKLVAINDGELGLNALRPRDLLGFALGV